MDYRPRQPARLPSIDAARNIEDAGGAHPRRCSSAQDKVGEFLRATLGPAAALRRARDAGRSPTRSTTSIARCAGASAGSWVRSRRGMRSASHASIDACGATDLPPLVAEALARGAFRPAAAARRRQRWSPAGVAGLSRSCARRRRRVVIRSNAGAQPGRSRRRRARGRVPLEDERDRRRHDPDAPGRRHARRPRTSAALVVGNEALNFSAGANLMLLLLEAQEGNWDEVDLMVRAFQRRDDGAASTRTCRSSSRRRASRSAAAARSACTATACRPRPRPTWGWSRSASG